MNVQGRLLLALASLVSSPAAVVAQEHGAEGGGGLFDINPGLSIWTIVVFLLLVFVLGRYAWGPILAAVDAREQRIQDSLDQASKQSEEIKALVAEQRQHLAAARTEAQQIVADGREAGQRVRREIEEKARSEGQSLIEAARGGRPGGAPPGVRRAGPRRRVTLGEPEAGRRTGSRARSVLHREPPEPR
jgi:hypothetical protein